jgi:hypothetical protein
VRLEASTKLHVHQKFEIFWTNIASTMACPKYKNGPQKGLRPLGVKKTGFRPRSLDHCEYIVIPFGLTFVIMTFILKLAGDGK